MPNTRSSISGREVLQPLGNIPTTPGRQVKALKSELEKKESENDTLKNNIADLTKALDSLNLVKEKAAYAIDSGSTAPKDIKKKTKDPDAPDPAMSAYRFFSDEMKKNDSSKAGKELQLLWKECKGDERKRFTDMATLDKARFVRENMPYQVKLNEREEEDMALEMYYEKQKQDTAMEFYEAHIAAQSLMSDKTKGKKVKDPDAPKRSLSSYMYFAMEKREQVAKDNSEKGTTEIAKMLGEMWGKLAKGKRGKNGTKKYDDLAAKDKERYDVEKAAYDVVKAGRVQENEIRKQSQINKDKEEAMKLMHQFQSISDDITSECVTSMANMQPIIATEQPKKKKTKAKGPKKGSSAYIFFSVNKRAEIKASMPEKTTNQELLSEIGRKWKELTVEEKKPFDELALKDKARYQKEMNALPQSIN